MAGFVWKAEYRVGDAIIDEQHEYLFALADVLLASQNKAELVGNVMKLYRYVREHFSHEESIMRRTGYPGYDEHVAMHNQLIERLAAISDDIGQDRWSSEDLQTFMNGWLLGHIREVDTKMAAYIMNEARPA